MRAIVVGIGLLVTLVGCGGGADPLALAGGSAPQGTWALSHVERANTCTEGSELFPLAPGDVEIEHRGAEVELSSAGEPSRTYAVEAEAWTRRRSEQIESCSASMGEKWILHGSSGSRLSASYEATLDLLGDCAFTGLRSCHVRYAVWGVRR